MLVWYKWSASNQFYWFECIKEEGMHGTMDERAYDEPTFCVYWSLVSPHCSYRQCHKPNSVIYFMIIIYEFAQTAFTQTEITTSIASNAKSPWVWRLTSHHRNKNLLYTQNGIRVMIAQHAKTYSIGDDSKYIVHYETFQTMLSFTFNSFSFEDLCVCAFVSTETRHKIVVI